MIKVAIFTSDQPRHLFFIKKIMDKINPVLVVQEEKQLKRKETTNWSNTESLFFLKSLSKSDKAKLKDQVFPNTESMKVKKGEINSDIVRQKLIESGAEVCLVFGTSILKKSIFSVPKRGCINIHTGLVQGYRGVHSCFWSVYNNDPSMIGVTIHQVSKGIDNGGVLLQARTHLDENDTIENVFFKTCALGFNLLAENINTISNKEFNTRKVSHGKLYQLKDMNLEIMKEINDNIEKVIQNYLKNKETINNKKDLEYGDFKWKL